MIEIALAIAQKATANPALVADLGGRFFTTRPPQGAKKPWGTIVLVSGSDFEYTTSTTYTEPCLIQISFFAEKLSDIANVIKAWKDALIYQPLALSTGYVLSAELTDENMIDEEPEDNLFAGIHYILQFKFTQKQNHQ